MKQLIETPLAPKPAGAYSQAIVLNGLVYCSGQVGLNSKTGKLIGETLELQAEQAIENTKNVLKAAGSSLEKVIVTSCFLTNLSEFPKFNEIYARHFGDTKPTRTTVGVASLPLGALIEIAVVAQI